MSYDFTSVYSGLKDFQLTTVDYVFKRMYLDQDPTTRFLVADEVGLGKTLVARGLIAKVVEHLQHTVDRIDIIYICSNAAIARQNVQRLNVTGKQDFSLPDRITLLPLHLHHLSKNPLNFVSFTPGTALDLKNQGGTYRERALLYWMLRRAWADDLLANKKAMNVFQGTVQNAGNWRRYLNDFPTDEISSELEKRFRKALQNADVQSRKSGQPTFKRRVDELMEIYSRKDKAHPWQEGRLRNRFIGELRTLLARSCIDALEPDLIILDEFQRFKHLLDGTDPAAALAHSLFESSDARVLLLSATPYKMYTLSEEQAEDDHYKDFLRTVSFLMPQEVSAFHADLDRFRRALFSVGQDGGSAARVARDAVESRLRRVMARTERLSLTEDRSGMLSDHQMPEADVSADDLASYLALDRLSKRLDAGDVLEYWKSSPYLLNFMEGYKLISSMKEAEDAGLSSELATLCSQSPELLLSWKEMQAWGSVDPGNARLRSLIADTVDRDQWRLLWLPPALPYYESGEPFNAPGLGNTTKRLVFSSWIVVPKVISTFLSFEAERRMVTSGSSVPYQNSPEDRARIRPLLRFHRTEGRLQGMTLFPLVYPSPTLADLGDPLRALRQGQSLNELAEHVGAKIQTALNPFLENAPQTGPVDDSWYWASPILLDSARFGQRAFDWFGEADLLEAWGADPATEDQPQDEQTDEEGWDIDWDDLQVGSSYNFRKPGSARYYGYVVVGKSDDEIDVRKIRLGDKPHILSGVETFPRVGTDWGRIDSWKTEWHGVPTPETLLKGRYYKLRHGALKSAVSYLVDEANPSGYVMRPVWRESAGNVEHGNPRHVQVEDIYLDISDETERWLGQQTAARGVLGDALRAAQDVAAGLSQLGRPPDDLVEVLTDIAIASPGVVSLRALSRISDLELSDDALRIAAARVSWALRNLFNLPDVSVLLRGSSKDDVAYWRLVIRYCLAGNFQAVLDEYAHVLPEWLGLLGAVNEETVSKVAGVMTESISLRSASYSVDEIKLSPAGLERVKHRPRARFAVRFGDDRTEEGVEANRTSLVRGAFNSPFWPFVLSTTSVGQEGLDFHLYCHAVVHWNLPSNPVDLEQREGRVHRYKGHAIRKNLATLFRTSLARDDTRDPWSALFAAADIARPEGQTELFPYWVLPIDGGAQIERYVPLLPLSREAGKLRDLKRTLGAYRVVFGQPRQEDLIAFLSKHVSPEDLEPLLDGLRIDLSPRP